VDRESGEEMNGTRVRSGEGKPICGECHRKLQEVSSHVDDIKPICTDDGRFQRAQCNSNTGTCWCVDEISGEPIGNTTRYPGEQLPTCGITPAYACDRIPEKSKCLPSGIPQTVLRYYSDGEKCKMYRYSYCPDEAHIPPWAIKYKQDCEMICLENHQESS